MKKFFYILLALLSLSLHAQQPVNRDNTNGQQVNIFNGTIESNGIKVPGVAEAKVWDTRDSVGLLRENNSRLELHNGINWAEVNNTITRVDIQNSSSENKRNDQASMIRLNDGRLMVAYSHFGPGSEDLDESSVHIQYSSDNGYSWSASQELVAPIALGSYIPSLYKKANGNILMVFFVREQATPVFLSSLRSIEYSPDMSTIVTAMETILSADGYSPVGSDRLFYDENTDRLLMPYPVLMSGLGSSTNSVYQTRFLISDDEGDTWADSGLTFDGFLNLDNYGGAMEPGFFVNKDKISIYSRNIVGNINACDLTWTGSAYTKGTEYKLKIGAMNAQSTVKYSPELRAWIASYTRLYDTPTSTRNQIDVSISRDATNWQKLLTVDDLLQVGGYMVNEPNILIDDKIYLTYSIDKTNGTYDLKLLTIPFESLMGIDNKALDTYTANPTVSEANEVSRSRFLLTSSFDASVFNNIFRSYVDIKEDVVSATPSSRSLPAYAFGQYFTNKAATIKHFNMGAISTLAPQQIFDGVHMEGSVHKLYFASFSGNSLKNGAHLEDYSPITIEEILPAGVTTGTIGTKYAFRQKGTSDRSYFLGHLGLGTNNPLYQLDVTGQGRFTSQVFAADATLSTQLATKGQMDTALALKANDANVIHTTGNESRTGVLTTTTSTFSSALAATGFTIKNIAASGGWARGLMTFTDNANSVYYELGGFGSNQTFNYGYIGFGATPYNSAILKWNATGFGIGISGTGQPAYPLDVTGQGRFTDTVIIPNGTLSTHAVNKGQLDLKYDAANILSGSATLDFPDTATGTSSELTISVTGAADGDTVSVGVPNASTNANSCFTARVSATNTVTVKFNNYSSGSINPASGTFKVRVIK